MQDLELETRQPTSFVAIDGEGLTRSDGTHDYVLLAASDSSYLEDYREESDGLSTEACLEYLLDLGERHKKTILVGFYTSYDVNMIFRDLPEYVLEGLWQGGIRTWRAGKIASAITGYRQYRIEYVPNRVLKIRQGCWTAEPGANTERVEGEAPNAYWKTFRSVTWWDCFQFFQMSFVKALKDWQATDNDTIEAIASMKDQRGVFSDEQRDSIRYYCQDECRLLVGLMEKVSATLDALDIRLNSWYGAGSIASALFKHYKVKDHIKQEWEIKEFEEAVMHAYFGGRVETFAVGVVAGTSINYDVRSAYPAATVDLPSLADCIVQRVDNYDYNERYAIWKVSWKKITSNPIRLAPFPFRHMKRIFWPHTGQGWYHASEVRAAMDVIGGSGITLTIEYGYRLTPSNNIKPFQWVAELYEARAEYKRNGDPREKIIKLALNSLYGKTAQSVGGKDGGKPPYQCYFWAGMITADCRAKLLRAASTSDNVLAIATDGLFVGERIEGLTESQALGAWESAEVEAGLMLIQPGVYATPSMGKKKLENGLIGFAKSRGFSARGIDYPALLASWRERRMSAEIKMPETRFIGFGYALAVGKLDTIWRRWIQGDKTIHFSGTTSKSFDPTGNHNADLVRLVAPNAPSDFSAPYVPRTRNIDDTKEYELQAELIASQPDLEDNAFTWR